MGPIKIDSRQVEPGDIFVAIRGGVNFVQDALDRGAVMCVVPQSYKGRKDDRIIVVEDTIAFLGEQARKRRAEFKGRVIGITGSAGKTTFKAMLSFALAASGKKVSVSKGNFNNAIGLPISILSADLSADFWVLELGTNRPGDIAYLTDIARPSIAFITSLYPSHLEGLIDMDGLAREKFAISRYAQICYAPIRFFWSFEEASRSKISFITQAAPNGFPYDAEHIRDMFGMLKALFSHLSLDFFAVDWGLFSFPERRFETIRLGNRVIIDDAYNANPGSMKASLSMFFNLYGRDSSDIGIVLGDMLELGEGAASYHRDVVAYARYLFPEAGFVFIGRHMSDAARYESVKGLLLEDWHRREDEILEFLKDRHFLFFKASNAMDFKGLIDVFCSV